ncbi:MAG: hypothetical protein KGZ80_12625 [Methylomonas sp.]|nr:hypothetical protein [Methylomonas sp.]
MKPVQFALLACPLIVFSNLANAASSFDTRASIQFVVQNLRNQSSPTSVVFSDVFIDASYEYRDSLKPEPFRSWLIGSGGASVSVPDAPVSLTGPYADDTRVFNHSFNVLGNSGSGELVTHQLGWYSWTVSNNSATDTFSLDLNFSYLLDAATAGDFSQVVVSLTRFSDEVPAFDGFADIEASAFALSSVQVQNSMIQAFSLSPGQSRTFNVDVVVNGSAVVPLPPAVWSFLLGLGLVFRQMLTRKQ